MPTDHEVAAPALAPTRIDVVSPWHIVRRSSRLRRWIGFLADSWREGIQLYARATQYRGTGWPWTPF